MKNLFQICMFENANGNGLFEQLHKMEMKMVHFKQWKELEKEEFISNQSKIIWEMEMIIFSKIQTISENKHGSF